MNELTKEQIEELEKKESGLYESEDEIIIPKDELDDMNQESEDVKNNQTPKEYKSTFIGDYLGLEESGYIQVNPELIPSECKYYPDDYKFFIKPAKLKNIRIFTDIANDEYYNINNKINVILNSCVKIQSNSGQVPYNKILEIDKIFFVIAIRDITFYKIPNPIKTKHICNSCNKQNILEIYSNNSKFFTETDYLKFNYNIDKKIYSFDIDNTGEILETKPPNIQSSIIINNYITNKNKMNSEYTKETLEYIKYLNLNWDKIDIHNIDEIIQSTYSWSIDKESAMVKFINNFKNSIYAKVYGLCNNCGTEVAPPFSVDGGFRNIFLIQN